MTSKNGPLRVGIGGPVGSGKTTLTEKLCKAARDTWSIGVVTNDIYTREDAEALARRVAELLRKPDLSSLSDDSDSYGEA